jgi:hypothetical protein
MLALSVNGKSNYENTYGSDAVFEIPDDSNPALFLVVLRVEVLDSG